MGEMWEMCVAMSGMWGIRVGMWGVRVGMQGIRVGMGAVKVEMWGIRVILCENLRVYCFGKNSAVRGEHFPIQLL